MRTERDLRNQMAYARESGYEEGREQGREEERARMVEELRKQGIPEDVIAQVTSGDTQVTGKPK